jgi:probable F420-dependent oxidoreductase
MVVLETNSVRARTIARATAERYLRLPNYTNNLLRLGYSQDELERGGSDRLIDEVIAWGDESAIMDRVRQHHAAGADHVCIQALTEAPQDLSKSMEVWRRLAPVLAR